MDQLLKGVRTVTFSWKAMNQAIACVLRHTRGSGEEIKGGTGWLKRNCRVDALLISKLSVAHFEAWSFTYSLRIKLQEGFLELSVAEAGRS
ncbi:hypothetical protein DY000_02016629 [Brassica cretica]|uniref:Uncharacterized protein n=1 Tax=Brassica cretica TaxID=69181 RepID=A0ABQ7DD15_BRACR|nr:hypothetical protein DY000_02016629 [Brassica cretica]